MVTSDWSLPAICHAGPRRHGTAAVEFALVAPILFLVVLGMIEISRAMMVGEMLNTAARSGCRAGTVLGATNSSVNSVVGQCLTGISGSTTSITVNGTVRDVSAALRGDEIGVSVTVPYSSVSWLPEQFLSGATLSASAKMYHE